MPSDRKLAAAGAGLRYLPLQAFAGKPARPRWGSLKFRAAAAASGAKLRSSIWVRNMRSRSKRVFLCC